MITIYKPQHLHQEFGPIEGFAFETIVVREIDADDEREAASILAQKGTDIEDRSTAMLDEHVRIAIVAVDGKNVEQPFLDIEGWGSRSRRFVLEAFTQLNAVNQGDVKDFLATAKGPNAPKADPKEEKKALTKEG